MLLNKLGIHSLNEMKAIAEKNGIKLGKCYEKGEWKYFYFSFSGISEDKIIPAVELLQSIWG